MLDVGWTELLVIGALALIVVGPRELPGLLRSVGQWVGKIRRMAREFQRTMEDAARDVDVANLKELRDLKKDIGGLDFRQQAAKAQSFLDRPAKAEAKGAAPKPAAKEAADAGTPPDAAAPGDAAADPSPAPAEGERRPPAAKVSEG